MSRPAKVSITGITSQNERYAERIFFSGHPVCLQIGSAWKKTPHPLSKSEVEYELYVDARFSLDKAVGRLNKWGYFK